MRIRVPTFVFMMIMTISISGCAPRTLEPKAETVKVIHYSHGIIKNCKFMGNISVENIHGDMYLMSSHQEKQLDDINFLKNEGKSLGANVVVLLSHERVLRDPIIVNRHAKNHPRVTYDIQGKAYLCPSVKSLKNFDFHYLKHDDIEETPTYK